MVVMSWLEFWLIGAAVCAAMALAAVAELGILGELPWQHRRGGSTGGYNEGMAKLVRCDECGREAREEGGVLNWLVVERYEGSLDFVFSGDSTPPLPWHFCGIPHLAAFAAKHDRTRRETTASTAR